MLELAMRRVKAQERLDDPDYLDRLTMDGYFDLLVLAGFSHDEARRETSQRSWDRLSAGRSI